MYSARITRLNPTAFIFLIDQSGSMAESVYFNSIPTTKADSVALATNMLIGELINRSKREDGIRDYFEIAVIGYNGEGAYPLLGDKIKFMTSSQLYQIDTIRRKVTRERLTPSGQSIITTVEQRCWIEAQAHGSTPMYDALNQAYRMAKTWCAKPSNSDSFPLTIFNITDGEASDASNEELLNIAHKIKSLKTNDGEVMLINIHLCSGSEELPIMFPSSEEEFGEKKYAKLLYEMSSQMPEYCNATIIQIKNGNAVMPVRAMSYNTGITDMIAMINIGSMSINLIQ